MAKVTDAQRRVELVPVMVDGKVQTIDIYIGGVWHGSRRTEDQCCEYVKWVAS